MLNTIVINQSSPSGRVLIATNEANSPPTPITVASTYFEVVRILGYQIISEYSTVRNGSQVKSIALKTWAAASRGKAACRLSSTLQVQYGHKRTVDIGFIAIQIVEV